PISCAPTHSKFPLSLHDALPILPNHPQYELATRMFRNQRYGGLLAFELKEQTREAAYRFMDKLQLCLPATTLGDVYSEVSYPPIDRKSTRLNSSHEWISYAVFFF